jgi:hypothetical protein
MFDTEMRKSDLYHTTAWPVLLILFLCAGCTKNLTVSTLLYENDFNSGDSHGITIGGWTNGSFGPVNGTRIIRFNESPMLGPLNNNNLIIILPSLPTHTVARVEADVYFHNNWRNELWNMRFDGNVILLTGFSNNKSVSQAYPDILGGTSPGPAGRDALDIQLPGICSQASAVPQNSFPNPSATSHYKIVQTFPHTARSIEVVMGDSGGILNDTCNRSWSIDNIKVTVFKN